MSDIPDHAHGDDGRVITSAPSDAEAEVDVVAVAASADVEVARIEADRDVTLAKLAVKAEGEHDLTEVEALKAELRGVQETLALLQGGGQPEPDMEPPSPVVIDQSNVEPEVEPPHAEESEEHRKPNKPRGIGAW